MSLRRRLTHTITIMALIAWLPLYGAQTAEFAPNQLLIKTQSPLPTGRSAIQSTHPVLSQLPPLSSVRLIDGQPSPSGTRIQSNPGGIYHLTFEEDANIQALCDQLQGQDGIEVAQPNYTYHTTFTPNDALFSSHQNTQQMDHMFMEEAWDINRGSSSIVIAIIDTGVLFNHEDITGRTWTNTDETASNGIDDDGNGFVDDTRGWDFVGDDNDPTDGNGHGTHVAGVAGGNTNNSVGTAGVCHNCELMIIQAASAAGTLSDADILPSVQYAIDNGAHVINMSFGGAGYSGSEDTLFEEKINAAASAGIVLVAAAGNNRQNIDDVNFRPAAYQNVIAVSASDTSGDFVSLWSGSDGSNFGPSIDVMAPGTLIASPDRFGSSLTDYGQRNGTSMAAPAVAGIVGLMLSATPNATSANIKQVLESTATDKGTTGFDIQSGFGLVNARDALVHILDTASPNIVHTELSPDINNTKNITATITDDGLSTFTNNIATASIFYRHIYGNDTPGAFLETPLSLSSGSTYTGQIPQGSGSPDGLQYYLQATDQTDKTSVLPSTAPTTPFIVPLGDVTEPTITFLSRDSDVIPDTLRVNLDDNVEVSPNTILVRITTNNSTFTSHRITDTNSILSLSGSTLTIDTTGFTFSADESLIVTLGVSDSTGNRSTNNVTLQSTSSTLEIGGPEGIGSRVLNVPNPFNPRSQSTDIWLQITKAADITVRIYSLNLQLMKHITVSASPGIVSGLTWDGTDRSGDIVPNGVYIAVITIKSDSKTITKRVKIAVIK